MRRERELEAWEQMAKNKSRKQGIGSLTAASVQSAPKRGKYCNLTNPTLTSSGWRKHLAYVDKPEIGLYTSGHDQIRAWPTVGLCA
jgi:hypothetical protein